MGASVALWTFFCASEIHKPECDLDEDCSCEPFLVRGREPPDPVHEWVTEGRRLTNEKRRARGSPEVPYSSCGDPGHAVVYCLGCRDEAYLNRDTDEGHQPWNFIGAKNNVSMLSQSPATVRGGLTSRDTADVLSTEDGIRIPSLGDILFVMNGHGGHIAGLLHLDLEKGIATTGDYGQPYAKIRKKTLELRGAEWLLDGHPLQWWIRVARLPRTELAWLPPGCQIGEAA